jgi:beta-glucanase (GH16 family)
LGSVRKIVILAAVLACSHNGGAPEPTPALKQWTLVWSDEFDGAAGARVDAAKWQHDLGDGCAAGICGWGNNEKETYTDSPDNVALNGQGQLAIVARVAPAGVQCYYGGCRYTSGKINTRGIFYAEPGRVEARIRLPTGQGLWPAFWMLGKGHPDTPWPDCGELDIMEHKGSQPTVTSSAVHGRGYSGAASFNGTHVLTGAKYADDFHLFAIEWDSTGARFFVDSTIFYAVTGTTVARAGRSMLNESYYIVLNLAVGGFFDGDPASDAILPATMLVDYVRVYRR